MLADQFGHVEHVHRGLAAKHRFEGRVSVYHPLVFLVLQPVLFDVGPQFLGHFGPGDWLGADHLRERQARCHRLHERGVGFPGWLLLHTLRHAISFRKTLEASARSVPRNPDLVDSESLGISPARLARAKRSRESRIRRPSLHPLYGRPYLNVRIVEHFGVGAAAPRWNHRSAQPRQRIVHPLARPGLAHYAETTRADT